jgi:HK97 family phage portal protein
VLGLTKALSGFATDFFENGSNIGGFISNGSTLLSSGTAYKFFQDSWKDTYSGIKNSHKVAILADGMTFTQLGAKLTDSQALESRQYAVIEICRMFGVPPHLVYDLSQSKYANVEQQNISYVQDALTPMAVRIEQTIYKDLLTTAEQNYYFAKLNLNGLLRGDTLTRTGYYNVMRQNGIMSANMILALEDENAIPAAEGGDALLVNGNMISLKSAMDNLPKSLQGKGGN